MLYFTTAPDDFDEVYKDVCTKGKKKTYRGRLNVIGRYRTGKTRLCRRLLRKAFNKTMEHTEGIAIHAVKIKAETWKEIAIGGSERYHDFHKQIISTRRKQKGVDGKIDAHTARIGTPADDMSADSSPIVACGVKTIDRSAKAQDTAPTITAMAEETSGSLPETQNVPSSSETATPTIAIYSSERESAAEDSSHEENKIGEFPKPTEEDPFEEDPEGYQ